jgi:hypothetical protein
VHDRATHAFSRRLGNQILNYLLAHELIYSSDRGNVVHVRVPTQSKLDMHGKMHSPSHCVESCLISCRWKHLRFDKQREALPPTGGDSHGNHESPVQAKCESVKGGADVPITTVLVSQVS